MHHLSSDKFNGVLSSSLPVTSGVPQGNILGLLFSIYINDLPDSVLFATSLLFADDTKCIDRVSSSIDHTLFQSDLDSLLSWSAAWGLSFNSKALCVSLSSHPTTFALPYFISSSEIATIDHHKDLGIIFTSNLSWDLHRSSVIINPFILFVVLCPTSTLLLLCYRCTFLWYVLSFLIVAKFGIPILPRT